MKKFLIYVLLTLALSCATSNEVTRSDVHRMTRCIQK
jgi:hypothetical protein